MSECLKHKQRKRKDCPSCLAESGITHSNEVKIDVKKIVRTTKPNKNTSVDKVDVRTSRDMLADLTKMEEDTDKIVMKKERKPRIKFELKDVPISKEQEETQKLVDDAIKDATRVAAFKKELENIDKFFKDKLEEFRSKVSSIANIQWEHLDINGDKCCMETIQLLEKDGWKYVDLYIQPAVYQVSGFSSPTAVFQRIKKDTYKKSVIDWKKEINGKGKK